VFLVEMWRTWNEQQRSLYHFLKGSSVPLTA
jgi:hypothetical protein